MEITIDSSIRFEVSPKSESTMVCKFKTKRTKNKIKIDVCTIIYFQNRAYSGMIDIIDSGSQSVYTSAKDELHTVEMSIPKFENRKQSFVLISIDPKESARTSVFIEDVAIEENFKYVRIFATPSNVDMIAAQQRPMMSLQAAMAIPNLKPKIGISSHVLTKSRSPVSILSQSRLQQSERSTFNKNRKVTIASSWDIKCGIAMYTEDLMNDLNKIMPDSFEINPIIDSKLKNDFNGELIHLQHEFSIIPRPMDIKSKVIITWHTISNDMTNAIRMFESKLNVVAHIVPCKDAADCMKTSKDVYVVNLGSKLMPNIEKEDARKTLGIDHINMPIGFVFGFQSANKNYERLENAAKNTGIHIIISGSIHGCGYKSKIKNNDNVTILSRHLTDDEVDLYAIASDLLLFDYIPQYHYSASSALHRTIGAGRPVVCVYTPHFNDIDSSIALKFNNQEELEKCIRRALDNKISLGRRVLEFAKETSREKMAMKHIEIYRKYIDF